MPPLLAASFTLTFDCLLQKIDAICRAIRERDVNVVLYLDRLDNYKVDALEKRVSTAGMAWQCRRGGIRGKGTLRVVLVMARHQSRAKGTGLPSLTR